MPNVRCHHLCTDAATQLIWTRSQLHDSYDIYNDHANISLLEVLIISSLVVLEKIHTNEDMKTLVAF